MKGVLEGVRAMKHMGDTPTAQCRRLLFSTALTFLMWMRCWYEEKRREEKRREEKRREEKRREEKRREE